MANTSADMKEYLRIAAEALREVEDHLKRLESALDATMACLRAEQTLQANADALTPLAVRQALASKLMATLEGAKLHARPGDLDEVEQLIKTLPRTTNDRQERTLREDIRTALSSVHRNAAALKERVQKLLVETRSVSASF
jgi:hypothetical protein